MALLVVMNKLFFRIGVFYDVGFEAVIAIILAPYE